MYVMAPGASIQALDATNGDLIWWYERDYPRGVLATAARSKSLGIYEDMIYFGAPDGFLVALDARSGKLRWETKVDEGQITAGGLLVADGKVISNRTCQQGKREFCFIAAHDARTGKELWKFHVTAAPGEPGGDTWGDLPIDQRPPARGACLARTIRSGKLCIGVWPIPIRTASSTRPWAPP
jgi:alcohol dehydrogenase (cytochrome c)